MSDLTELAWNLVRTGGSNEFDQKQYRTAMRDFTEAVTYADVSEIRAMLRELLEADWMGLPVWARNLSFRLACLQSPDDPQLLREAASDLAAFGPDWDDEAVELQRRADALNGRS